MRFFYSRQGSARFLQATGLGQTGDVDTCSARHSRPRLKCGPAGSDSVVISCRHIMTDGYPDVEDRVLRIVWAHSNRLLEVDHRVVRLSVKRECPAEIAMSCREVRVELQSPLEFGHALGHAPLHESDVTQREVRPRVAVVELRRTHS